MFRVFSSVTADEVWLQIASAFCDAGAALSQSSRNGPTQDLGHVAISVLDPRQRWVVSRKPALNPAFAIAEVVWIVNGRDDAEFLNYFNRQLPRFAGTGDKYTGAYGQRLRNHWGIDQLNRAYHALSNCKTSRQVVLQIWDPRVDLPTENGAPTSPDVPCNVVSLLKVRGGALEWTQIMRSNDVFRGLPHNFVQFTTLHEVMAGWLGVELGRFHLVTDSLHQYDNDQEFLGSSQRLAMIENKDSLSLPKSASELAFEKLAETIETIIDPSTNEQTLVNLADAAALPPAYENMLRVLVAEGLRRRQRLTSGETVISKCSNDLFIQLWNNWLRRIESNRTIKRSVTL